MAFRAPATDPETVAALRRRGIKDPGSDATIVMARDRHLKNIKTDDNRLKVSACVGAVLKKDLDLAALEKEIKILEDGKKEFNDQIWLLNEERKDITKAISKDIDWCSAFDRLIGPFEAKYEECKAEVKVSFDYAKDKYAISLQKLIDDFGFHPAFKRWFDEF